MLLAPLAIGWLASGSCSLSACYEECDPCYQACKCSNLCQNLVAGESGLSIVAHTSRIVESSRARFVRQFEVLVGPTLELTTETSSARLVDFARRVLDVNVILFTAEREPRWSLAAVHAFRDSTAIAFELQSPASRRSNSVTLVFDATGRLLELTHVVDRTLP